MSLFDFFFPEQAQASHLRRLADNHRSAANRARRSSGAAERRVEALEHDVGYIALVLAALLQQVDAKGVLSRDEVRETIAELDGIDGVADGRMDVNVLRGLGR